MKTTILSRGEISQGKGYHGWPTVIRTKENELMAVCSGGRRGHVCPFGRLYLYRSVNNGLSWHGPEILSQGPLDDRDAGICQATDGSILVNYFTSTCAFFNEKWAKEADAISLRTLKLEHGFWMRRSVDEGKSFSEKYSVPVSSPHGPTLLQDGRLFYVGECLDPAAIVQRGWRRCKGTIACALSRDNGESWEMISDLPSPEGHLASECYEPYGIQAPDGRWIVQIRVQSEESILGAKTWQTESEDEGKSWSRPHTVCDGFPTHLLRLPKDVLLMTYGWRNSSPYGIRARLSLDSARTWNEEEIMLADDAPNIDVGYPSTAQLEDGSLFTLYYQAGEERATLKYCRWTLEL